MTAFSPQQTSRGQLAAVVLALGLATLTFLIPLAVGALFLTAVLAFAAGATALRLAHGLEPGPFSAGFYLATLLLLGAGGWQLVHTVRAWQAGRSLRKASAEEGQSEALVPNKPKPGGAPAALKQQPFMLLGAALLVADAFLVRWEIRGKLDSPDGLLAAAILASMVWAQILVAVLSVRLTLLLWRALVRSSRRSPYAAGLVTAFGLAISLASVLGLRSSLGDAAEAASRQSVVTSIEGAPSASSPIEQMRLALVEFAEPKKTEDRQPLVKETAPVAAAAPEGPTDPAALADAAAAAASALAPPAAPVPAPSVTPAAASEGESLPAAAAEESEAPLLDLSFGPPFAKCVDRLTQRSTDDDPIQREVARIVRRFGISEHDARALVIETLVSVCLKKGEDNEDLRRYLQRSITNAAHNFRSRHLNRSRTCSIELVPVVDFPDDSGWHFADDTETRAQQAFCSLSELDQAIIQARVMRELTFRQIGDIIGLTEDGARKAFDRALRRLKEKFEKS